MLSKNERYARMSSNGWVVVLRAVACDCLKHVMKYVEAIVRTRQSCVGMYDVSYVSSYVGSHLKNTYGCGVEDRGGCAPARGWGGGERERTGADGGDYQIGVNG